MKFFYFLSLSFLILILCSCHQDKVVQPQTNEDQPLVVIYDSQDSLAIRQLTNEYVNYFNAHDYESAANMLFTVRNDSVFPLNSDQREGFLNAIRQLPNYGCALKDMTLNTFKDNKVRLAVLVNEQGNLENEISCVNFYLNPVNVNGQWCLTLYDRYAEGVGEYLNVVHE